MLFTHATDRQTDNPTCAGIHFAYVVQTTRNDLSCRLTQDFIFSVSEIASLNNSTQWRTVLEKTGQEISRLQLNVKFVTLPTRARH